MAQLIDSNQLEKLAMNNRGFSLVEMAIVLGIISILATIGVVNFQQQLVNSRRQQAWVHLSSIYSAEKTYLAEYAVYFSDFRVLGHSPIGGIEWDYGFGMGSFGSNNSPLYGCPAAPGTTANGWQCRSGTLGGPDASIDNTGAGDSCPTAWAMCNQSRCYRDNPGDTDPPPCSLSIPNPEIHSGSGTHTNWGWAGGLYFRAVAAKTVTAGCVERLAIDQEGIRRTLQRCE